MKKLRLLFLVLILIPFMGYSQSQQELLPNGTFEDTIASPWGAYAADAANGAEDFRTTDAAYEGEHSVRVWDHTYGVFIWHDIGAISDTADYTISFWYKGDLKTLFDLAIGRDLGYDLVGDPDGIVPDTAAIVSLNENENAAIEWALTPKSEWTYFSYTWGFDDWLGLDPESGDPIVGSVAIMFANADYAADAFDGPCMYFDNVSMIKTPWVIEGTNKMATSTLKVYPNPTQKMIHIQAENSISTVKIFDLSGREVLTLNQPGSTIDVSGLNPGLYMINAFSDKGTNYISKFIKK